MLIRTSLFYFDPTIQTIKWNFILIHTAKEVFNDKEQIRLGQFLQKNRYARL